MQLTARIETRRLILRKPELADAEDIFANYAADLEVTRFLTWTPHVSVNESREVLNARLAHWELGSDFTWCLVPRDGSARIIGMISAAPDEESPAAKFCLGCVLGRPWWNGGYMTEALSAVIAMLFAQPQTRCVWAYTDEENHASMRVLEKAGMRREVGRQQSLACPTIGPEPRAAAVFSVARG